MEPRWRIVKRTHRFFVVAVSLIAMAPVCSHAQDARKIVETAQGIAQSWTKAIKEGRWIIRQCANNTFSIARLVKHSTVSIDVQKTNSLIHPYISIVSIHGSLESNVRSPRANGFLQTYEKPAIMMCFKTPQGALAATAGADLNDSSEGRVLTIVARYELENGEFKLINGNDVFRAQFGNDIFLDDNRTRWADVISRRLSGK